MPLESIELVGGTSVLKGSKEVIRYKVKAEEGFILFHQIDKEDEEALDALIEAARESNLALINIEEINKKWREGVTSLLVWDYAHSKFVPIEITSRVEKHENKEDTSKAHTSPCFS